MLPFVATVLHNAVFAIHVIIIRLDGLIINA